MMRPWAAFLGQWWSDRHDRCSAGAPMRFHQRCCRVGALAALEWEHAEL